MTEILCDRAEFLAPHILPLPLFFSLLNWRLRSGTDRWSTRKRGGGGESGGGGRVGAREGRTRERGRKTEGVETHRLQKFLCLLETTKSAEIFDFFFF